MATRKMLFVFDFDQTIINCNIDVWIRRLLPNGKVPKQIKDRYKEHDSWTQYMADIFSHLHSSGIHKSEILDSIAEVPFTPGMVELLKYQQTAPSIDTIIASDANSLFISHILESADLQGAYQEIFSNPAEFDEAGCIGINHYHKHECQRCPVNLCKATVLKAYLQKKSQIDPVVYDTVAFVGDGTNDFCPCLSLGENDLIFARKGYRLMEEIEQCMSVRPDCTANCKRIKATVIPWDDAFQILHYVQEIYSSKTDKAN
ncbi:pyridoxal phosphate phosphatase PHOSPHO2-like isoform X2 [Acanthaster planci]|nr:pyridoxal phosphate phosphatase PHOSPHO2-like isoform X2 [Acanthaster planci]